MTASEFIDSVLPGSCTIQQRTGLPAAVMIAQACLETGWGKYVSKDMNTGQFSFNLFNIKGVGPAGSVLVKTWEVYNGVSQTVNDYFRAYSDYSESFADYANLITQNSRYAPAVAAQADPEEYARQLQYCGYATDPAYASKLIQIIHANNIVERVNQAMQNINGPIEDWENISIQQAMDNGLFLQYHTPREIFTASEIAAVANNILATILARLQGGK